MENDLRAVGYWRSLAVEDAETEEFPDPHDLVAPEWCLDERLKILRYLRAGHQLVHWRGLSPCRFGCGHFGSRCLTDNEWVWPEGLEHYVETHTVRLPSEFIESMRRNLWVVPKVEAVESLSAQERYDFEFWIRWAEATGEPRK